MQRVKLCILDFDETLFRSPYPPDSWDEQQQGEWWAQSISLGPPAVPETPGPEWWNQTVVAAARERLADPCWYCCLLTGRAKDEADFVDRIPTLLVGQDLHFDEVHLSPSDRTAVWKIGKTLELAQQLDVKTIEQWDDRADHLAEFRAALEPQYCLIQHHVQEPRTTMAGFRYRGRQYIALTSEQQKIYVAKQERYRRATAEEFITAVQAGKPRWRSVEIDVRPDDYSDDVAELANLRVKDPLDRRQGLGSKAMEWITGLADQHDVTLKLHVEPFGKDAPSKGAIRRFYRQHGFRDRPQGWMVRRPRERLG
ncbi:hypothetical protein LCGC14_0575780 [marine sediment metagenome]|uniref:Swiss Army Knife RNA repair protein HAD domain-containing protein n=1 Tax=marine sediment metagenome TaxID=412755 RepID=A0A0F9RHW0_9ZZZZ